MLTENSGGVGRGGREKKTKEVQMKERRRRRWRDWREAWREREGRGGEERREEEVEVEEAEAEGSRWPVRNGGREGGSIRVSFFWGLRHARSGRKRTSAASASGKKRGRPL
ncbi:hypothetical protein BO70DRAFT_3719 [Aspergillus heteromorphus CBS 117.55]|uniref:Uncharacterized protein n=1 Tax=Aspergillus heteromorphus CBS 117.55 TaxID=1448321 RepID=A0A317X0G7_9EURO|nr:uncharacterized protein BO70DRAFT_3719 [Aspergillus heteromorphus CBS 117.55]PWY92134.1 hypothetical protein BO70DRAFT_3719 [Aspergillus heteromorphus CBS 117.55]